MQNPENVTNPGLVNVADQGDGLTVIDQEIAVGPSYNPGPLVQADAEGFGVGDASPDQPVTVSPSQSSASAETASSQPGETVSPGLTNAGTYSPQGPDVINTTENTVVNQIYGTGNPANVFV